jgi:hypothetical protein
MLQRCENPDHVAYRYYGAKGRSVCKRWRDIRLFVEDIERDLGPRPDGMTLDRIDSDGNYEPGNVRWATAAEQVANSTLTYGERSGKARLTDLVVIECRRRYAAGETQAALAREFGIGAGHMVYERDPADNHAMHGARKRRVRRSTRACRCRTLLAPAMGKNSGVASGRMRRIGSGKSSLHCYRGRVSSMLGGSGGRGTMLVALRYRIHNRPAE